MEKVVSKHRVALVTNAADYAGPPAFSALIAAGFRVLVHDNAFGEPATWSAFLRNHPGAERILAEHPAELIEAVWMKEGRLDALVSNDHYPAPQSAFTTTELTHLRNTLEALLVRPFALLQAAVPKLKRQGGANIVLITSCRTRSPIAGGAVPDAARAAANALVRSLSVELAPDNIAINAIAPNFLYSEAYYPRSVFVESPRGKAYIDAHVPIGRLGRPEEIGEVVSFLATTHARFLTGAVIDFSGGWPATAPRPS
ncbi:short-chain dehydrogenase [Burkholderiaceae bacterium 16]|nr:short-chain dehydrogenase [Burkholderiaceae bacterium 16]